MEHYKAAMVLSGAGDALGYRNQLWEYNESGPAIHQVSADLEKKKAVLLCSKCLTSSGSLGTGGAWWVAEHQG